MEIIVFISALNNEQKDRVIKCMDLLKVEYSLYDVPSFSPESVVKNKNTIIITFGKMLTLLIKDQLEKRPKLKDLILIHYELIHPKFLNPVEENIKHRKETFDQLKNITEFIESVKQDSRLLKEQDISLQNNDIDQLSEVATRGIIFEVKTQNNDMIYFIPDEKLTKSFKDKNYITHSELDRIKEINNIFGIKEIILRKDNS